MHYLDNCQWEIIRYRDPIVAIFRISTNHFRAFKPLSLLLRLYANTLGGQRVANSVIVNNFDLTYKYRLNIETELRRSNWLKDGKFKNVGF